MADKDLNQNLNTDDVQEAAEAQKEKEGEDATQPQMNGKEEKLEEKNEVWSLKQIVEE